MGLEMKISVNLDQVTEFLSEFKGRALVNATRKSMNRAVASLRTHANRKVREHRKLKASEINSKFFRMTKARGSRLDQLEASLEISGKPVSLIRFVVGKKEGRSQKGIPVRKRKPVVVEVRPGRRVKLKGAFIAQGRGGNNQVFRRRTKKRFPIVKQSVPSLAKLFEKPSFRNPLEKFAEAKLGSEFARTFKFELNRLIERKR